MNRNGRLGLVDRHLYITIMCLLFYHYGVAQPTWTGTIDSDYENAGNWSPVQIPTFVDDVIIPDGTPNIPVVTSVNAQARTIEILDSLRIASGGILAIDEGNGSGRV